MKTAVIAICFITAAAAIGFVAVGDSGGLAAESVSDRVDRVFTPWNKPDSPGCSVAVGRNGMVLFERGYGMANLELAIPITPSSRFHVASISKPMTAMSILLLAERGRLSIDDEVRKYIPEFPDFGTRITIRHLLEHTSGLRDAYLLRDLAEPYDESTDRDRIEALVQLIGRQKELNFTPRSEFQYNNGGYTVLAAIVKRVSGETLGAFTTSKIFKPLGMANTRFHDDPTMLEPNRATGYHRNKNSWDIPVYSDLGRIVGNTGLFTTARDLLIWEQNFAEPRVGSAAMLASMQTPAVLTGGATSPYGLGVFVGEYRKSRTISHSGGDPGVAANLVRYPDRGLSVAILCNFEDPPLEKLTNEVSDIFLGNVQDLSAKTSGVIGFKPVQLTPEQLAARTGVYRDPVHDSLGRVFTSDGKLMAEAGPVTFELIPVSANRFDVAGTSATVKFTSAEQGHAEEIRISGVGKDVVVLQKVDTPTLSGSELNAFAGQFTSGEIDSTYTLTVVDSNLVIRRRGRLDIVLQPVYSDTFQNALTGVIKFSRDAHGIVTGFAIKTDGVRHLLFDRLIK